MTYRLLINGELVDGASTLPVVNPATGAEFALCARADAVQLERAVEAARASFRGWADRGQRERNRLLDLLAAAVEERGEEFARLLTREQGKPLAQARAEIATGIRSLRYYARIELSDATLRETDDAKIVEYRTPLGVVAAITPWNFPFSLLMIKLAPALSAGNTMVAKPAPTTPLTTLLFGEIAADILPPGVLNLIVDDGDLGPHLAAHPEIAKITFTGSSATGRLVFGSAAETLKRITLELGGNDAAIILDDVDIAAVAREVFLAATVNCGQVCIAAKRIFVPRSIYPDFCDALAKLAREAVVGDGLGAGCQIGPLQNRRQYERILELLASARRDGTVLCGGEAMAGSGYFVSPAVVIDIADDARLVAEEQFGPLIPVLAYDRLDEVVERANATPYGLAGSVWTADAGRGAELARRIDSGTVWVNKHYDLPIDIPFGGAKQSGIGREKGVEGLHEFTQAKILNINKMAVTG